MNTTPVPGTPSASTPSAAASASDHLWIPEPVPDEQPIEQGTSSSRSAQLLTDRLYVGNLGTVVNESVGI